MSTMQSELAHLAQARSLGALTASIAHEVNQPLASIIMTSEASLRWLAQPEPDLEEVRELTRRVVGDARRAAEIIDGIRAMVTRRAPKQAPLSLNAVVQEALDFLQHDLLSNGTSVTLDLAGSLPQVLGDRTQLQQVIVNLITNAAQAMAQSGTVRRAIRIRTLLLESSMVSCIVEDSGPGIDPVHISHLFDSFFTTKEGGMGMGLSISQSIVEAHRGRIRADNDSTLGGARFSLALPCHPGSFERPNMVDRVNRSSGHEGDRARAERASRYS